MKKIFYTILLLLFANCCLAQKPPVDFSVVNNWPYVSRPVINNNGTYAVYSYALSPFAHSAADKLVVQQIKGNWKKDLPGANFPVFTADGRTLITTMPGDSLCLLKLGTTSAEYITSAQSYKLFNTGTQEYLAVKKNTPGKDLLLRNLTTGKQQNFTGINDFFISPNGSKLILRIAGGKESAGVDQLAVLNMASGKQAIIGKGFGLSNFVFNKDESKLAFAAMQVVDKHFEHVFYCYTQGEAAAIKIADNRTTGIDTSLGIERITHFTKDGKRLFFTLKAKPVPPVTPTGVKVDVWSYRDAKLQSEQLGEISPTSFMAMMSGNKELPAVLDLAKGKVICLGEPDDQQQLPPAELSDDYTFPTKRVGEVDETYWNKAAVSVYYIVNTHTGNRTRIDLDAGFRGVSLGGKFVVGKKDNGNDYYAMQLATGNEINLTAALPILKTDDKYEYTAPNPGQLEGIVGWLENDDAVLIADKYDIWQLDLTGKKQPVNLTGGYGRKMHIVFRLVQDNLQRPIKATETLILTAFNTDTKDNGFYNLQMNKPGKPQLLITGPYLYFDTRINPNSAPVKAKDANVWIVSRESSSESLNLFTTSDFKTLTPLTNVHPEKKYNWLTTQLMSAKTAGGTNMLGVLYKPENFDPAKKYPVIFYYYEGRSDELHVYRQPEASEGWMDIPWFVSHGYVVYSMDIHYYPHRGEPGRCALEAVLGSEKMLAKFPWVDTAHMGIQGHSWGGFETLYIVTHTNIFAAAMGASGIADAVGDYNSLMELGTAGSIQSNYERGQLRIGATLWERPELFLKNSPVLRADKVTTPLLMMSNINDGAVPYANGLEMFTSLRRLGKRAWLLQYDGQAHSLWGDAATKDYTIRMEQFFDHYLKGAPAPMWMLKGIPATKKGMDSGLELSTEKDANGNPVTPGPGLLK